MQREKLSKIHQVVLGVALGLAFIVIVEAMLAIDDGVSIHFMGGGENRWSMTHHDGRDRIKVRSRGDVELLEEGGSMGVEVGAGGHFRVDAREDGERRRLEMGENGSIDYRVAGERRDFDAQARLWLSDLLLEIVRRGGFDAEERALRLYESRGAEGLLAEIAELGGDEVRRRYFAAVFDRDALPAADLATLLAGAGRLVGSDHALMQTLHRSDPERLADGEVAGAYFSAAGSISSDHALRRALEHALEGPLGVEARDELFESAGGLGSDHEAARLVVAFSGARSGVEALPESLPEFLAQIGSDHEQRRAIEALLEGSLDAEERDRLLLVAAAGLGSDHEVSELLRVHAGQGRGTASAAALTLLETIGSDAPRLRAALALLEGARSEQLPALIDAADLPGYARFQLLDAVAGVVSPAEATPELREAVRRSAAGLDDERRRRLLETWAI